MGDYYIGYTPKNKTEYYFDKECFDVVKQYKWRVNSDLYPITFVDGKEISMVTLLFGNSPHTYKNGKKNDLRKENICNIKGFKDKGRVFLNGYVSIYMPEHKRAFDNGCVYEHILVAERTLGRELKPDECVHHKDQNRTNNSPENLMVFATNNDHVAFHGGAKAILTDEGNYKTERLGIPVYIYRNRTAKDIKNNIKDTGSVYVPGYNLCPCCNENIKSSDAKMCLECYRKLRVKNIPKKEELEALIYQESFEEIGRMYKVSGKAVTKWCKKYGLPSRRSEINKILATK